MKKHRDSVDGAILERIRSRGFGKVHSAADFLDLGTRAAVDQALSRNVRSGELRRVGRGMYDLPHRHRIWGVIDSTPEAVVEAVARRDGLTIRQLGAAQAGSASPGRASPGSSVTAVFLTNGTTRRIRHGKGDILLKHAAPRTLAAGGRPHLRRPPPILFSKLEE